MILASEVTAGEVTAFIGPLVAMIGLIGGLIAWIISRNTKFVKNELSNVQAITNERIAGLTEQLIRQGNALENLQKETRDTAITVARIEGKLTTTKEGSQ